MKLRLASPSLLVDIGQVDELNSGVTCNDGTISISSLTTHATIASSDTREERLSGIGGGGGHDR